MFENSGTPEDMDQIELPAWMDDDAPPLRDPGFLVFGQEGESGANGPARGPDGEPRSPKRRNVYKSSEWTRVSPRVFRCRVTVSAAEGEFTGAADGPEVPGVRAEISARATIDALNRAEGDGVILALKGARVLRVFESPIVVVGMYALNAGETTSLLGACLVHNSVEEAAIQATLQAADRWLAWQAHSRAH